MKLLKKALMLTASLLACIGIGVAAGCGGKTDNSSSSASSSNSSESVSSEQESESSSESVGGESSSEDSESDSSESTSDSSSDSSAETISYVYRIGVKNAGGYGFPNVTVDLYNGETKLASQLTGVDGYALFTESDIQTLGEYTVAISGYPDGYEEPQGTFVTTPIAGSELNIPITPTGLKSGKPANGTHYQLGDIVHDFTVNTTNGTFTLSEALKTNDAVLLNFWATWCGPCQSEFPAMNDAYMEYSKDERESKVTVLAVSTTDSYNDVLSFQTKNGLAFPMASSSDCSINLLGLFGVSGIPHSVIIDRYGVVAFNHVGSMTEMRDFSVRFDQFLGEDYVPTILPGDGSGSVGGDTGLEYVKPNVAAPSLTDVKTALGADDGFSFRWQSTVAEEYDEYSWPWILSDAKDYLYTPNKGINNSYATLYVDFTATANTALCFDYLASTESYDKLYVLIDGVVIHQLSGVQKEWQTCYAYVFKDFEAGEHELALLYLKDEDGVAGDDTVKIKNLRFVNANALDSPDVNANVFRYAATQLNTDANATTQYKNYITPVLNEEDGYYHVGEANGPILFANMMYESLWNLDSLWNLALAGYCTTPAGADLKSVYEQYAWEAANNFVNYGYTPVTAELKDYLDFAVNMISQFQKWQGAYHSNEWLELCVYYEHYGQTPQMEDPLKTISFHAAAPLVEGENEVEVKFAMTPRGFKYKFIPTRSGVFNVYTDSSYDTVCFLMASDKTTFLGTYDDVIGETTTNNKDVNFNFHYYFEEGETYYLLFTTYLDVKATYTVHIKYVGETYTYFEYCATGPYSFNLATLETFIPNAIEYKYSDPASGGDGYYHVVNTDGSLGSAIYLDVNRPTAMFYSDTIKNTCELALMKDVNDFDKDGITDEYVYEPYQRAFYVNGVDYTPALMEYCELAMANKGKEKGFVKVDKGLYDILYAITTGKFDGIWNSWLMCCYYYVTLGA